MNYLNAYNTFLAYLNDAYALIGLTLFCRDSYHRKFTMCMGPLVNNHSKLYILQLFVLNLAKGFEAQVGNIKASATTIKKTIKPHTDISLVATYKIPTSESGWIVRNTARHSSKPNQCIGKES
jgi:hypothetical protein